MATAYMGDSSALVDMSELVDAAQQGSPESFARLYDRYVSQVYAYVLHRVGHRPTAEDLTADVFLRALHRVGCHHRRDADFGAWLLRIAKHRVNDHFKAATFHLGPSVEAAVVDPPSSDGFNDPGAALPSQKAARQVRTALRQLKGEQAEILYLRFVHHLDVAKTASATGRSAVAVRTLQRRALRSLATLVGMPPDRRLEGTP